MDFVFNSDQIGIPLFNFRREVKNEIIRLVEGHGFTPSYHAGDAYISINFKHKVWFTHERNLYYPDLPIEDKANPFPEIKQFFLTHVQTDSK